CVCRCEAPPRVCQLRRRRRRRLRGTRRKLSADRSDPDGIGRADVTLRCRPRPAICRGSRELRRAGRDLGISAGSMTTRWVIAPLAVMVAITGWCGSAAAFRPFDGTDAAVADTGKVEIELGPVEYRRESAARTLFAPSTRVNYGFAPDWEAVIEGRVSHGLSGDS